MICLYLHEDCCMCKPVYQAAPSLAVQDLADFAKRDRSFVANRETVASKSLVDLTCCKQVLSEIIPICMESSHLEGAHVYPGHTWQAWQACTCSQLRSICMHASLRTCWILAASARMCMYVFFCIARFQLNSQVRVFAIQITQLQHHNNHEY